MTDTEIIKALECCKEAKLNQHCLDLKCPFATKYGCNIDADDLRNKALNIISRLKKEIERLQKENERFADIGKMYSEIRAEAVKEFWEKLKQKKTVRVMTNFGLRFSKEEIEVKHGDNLVKEMTEKE